MKFKYVVLLAMGVAMVSGCTSSRDLADGGFGYLDVEERPPLVIPENLEERPSQTQFEVPAKTPEMQNAPKGAAVSIRSPRQILALAPGSRVEESSRTSTLSFDAVDGVSDLPAWVWSEVERILRDSGANFAEYEDERLIVTDRFRMQQHTIPRTGFFNRIRGQRVAVESEQTLTVAMTAPSHRRTVSVTVNADQINWLEDGRAVREDRLPAMLQRNIEADFLNTLSSNLNQSYTAGRVAAVQTGLEFDISETADGYPAVRFFGDFNTGWIIWPGVMADLGFVVEDLNQTDGMYYGEYQPGGKRGWFSRMFRRGERGPLDLARGTEVNFSVDEENGLVFVVPMIDGNPIDRSMLDAWVPALEEAFRNLNN
ncbi:outer membrane protein assembly factor BamC [Aliidiomarina indica]|uniref:outer membrane protein assembly factor BamC n=1 Tax=Aliidiomarina indica TaxID=2749147 RepID=UPI00188FC8E5|nr:outer membrane protein assembly factor BamC [Aliidiomarina indica]